MFRLVVKVARGAEIASQAKISNQSSRTDNIADRSILIKAQKF